MMQSAMDLTHFWHFIFLTEDNKQNRDASDIVWFMPELTTGTVPKLDVSSVKIPVSTNESPKIIYQQGQTTGTDQDNLTSEDVRFWTSKDGPCTVNI